MGALFLKGGKDLLFGKKGPAFAPHKMLELDAGLKRSVDAGRAAQQSALGELTKQDSGQIARGQISRGLRGINAASEDAKRNMEARIAQRGMGRSSIGISAAAELDRKAGMDKQSLIGSLEERKRDATRGILDASNRVLATPGAQRTVLKGQTPRREGGLLDIASKFAGPAATLMACWVAREIFGETNPKWLDARNYVLNIGPKWFKKLYLEHGEDFAKIISKKPILKKIITPLFIYFAWRGGDKKTISKGVPCLK
jgi:hypothetical protein